MRGFDRTSLNKSIRGTANGNESSARTLGRYFAANGIELSQLKSEHLLSLYHDLCRLPGAALSQCHQLLGCEALDGDTKGTPTGVIIETRRHALLERVVNNVVDLLGIPVQLFHGTGNVDFIRNTRIGNLERSGIVKLHSLDKSALDARAYNALLLNREFWNCIEGRGKVLIFQTDSLLCSATKYSLEDFLGFDYIGSRWRRERPVGLTIDGGNGGLSLRDWRGCTGALERFDPQYWPGAEDGFFAFHLDLMGMRVGTAAECAQFSSQFFYDADSFGVHKPGGMQNVDLVRFLKYCPEAEYLIQPKSLN